jgi:hypothetical protein
MTSMSSSDALIDCWDDKAHWLFWRAVTAIAEAENDGNPATSTEAGWTPLLTTPPYPDHPSGFNCFTAGMMYAGKNFFGTNNVEISFTTPAVTTPSTRTYSHLSAVLRDTINARVWLGIPLPDPRCPGCLAREEGRELGRQALLRTGQLDRAIEIEKRRRPEWAAGAFAMELDRADDQGATPNVASQSRSSDLSTR